MNSSLANNLSPSELIRYVEDIPRDALEAVACRQADELRDLQKEYYTAINNFHDFMLVVENFFNDEEAEWIEDPMFEARQYLEGKVA